MKNKTTKIALSAFLAVAFGVSACQVKETAPQISMNSVNPILLTQDGGTITLNYPEKPRLLKGHFGSAKVENKKNLKKIDIPNLDFNTQSHDTTTCNATATIFVDTVQPSGCNSVFRVYENGSIIHTLSNPPIGNYPVPVACGCGTFNIQVTQTISGCVAPVTATLVSGTLFYPCPPGPTPTPEPSSPPGGGGGGGGGNVCKVKNILPSDLNKLNGAVKKVGSVSGFSTQAADNNWEINFKLSTYLEKTQSLKETLSSLHALGFDISILDNPSMTLEQALQISASQGKKQNKTIQNAIIEYFQLLDKKESAKQDLRDALEIFDTQLQELSDITENELGIDRDELSDPDGSLDFAKRLVDQAKEDFSVTIFEHNTISLASGAQAFLNQSTLYSTVLKYYLAGLLINGDPEDDYAYNYLDIQEIETPEALLSYLSNDLIERQTLLNSKHTVMTDEVQDMLDNGAQTALELDALEEELPNIFQEIDEYIEENEETFSVQQAQIVLPIIAKIGQVVYQNRQPIMTAIASGTAYGQSVQRVEEAAVHANPTRSDAFTTAVDSQIAKVDTSIAATENRIASNTALINATTDPVLIANLEAANARASIYLDGLNARKDILLKKKKKLKTIGEGAKENDNELENNTGSQEEECVRERELNTHGGGKSAKHMNPDKRIAAEKRWKKAQEDLAKAKAMPPSKERTKAIKQAQKDSKHWKEKMDETGEAHWN